MLTVIDLVFMDTVLLVIFFATSGTVRFSKDAIAFVYIILWFVGIALLDVVALAHGWLG